MIFYVISIFLVGLCVSSEDERLLDAIDRGDSGAGASPFVIAIVNGGISVLPSILNAVILSSAWSAGKCRKSNSSDSRSRQKETNAGQGNAFFYASTRILYSSALDGRAPKIFKFTKFGVPYACVAATSALSLLAYLNVSNASSEVFFWFSNISAVSTLLVWGSICSKSNSLRPPMNHH